MISGIKSTPASAGKSAIEQRKSVTGQDPSNLDTIADALRALETDAQALAARRDKEPPRPQPAPPDRGRNGLRSLMARLDRLARSPGTSRSEKAVIRNELSRLATRIEADPKAGGRDLALFLDRVDRGEVRRTAEANAPHRLAKMVSAEFAARPGTAAPVERMLADLTSKLDRALAEMPRSGAMAALVDRMEGAAKRLEVAERGSERPDFGEEIGRLVAALAEINVETRETFRTEIRTLGTKLDQRAEAAALDRVAARFDEVKDVLDRRLPAADTMEEIERALARLGDPLALPAADPALTTTLDAMRQTLDRVSVRLAHLEGESEDPEAFRRVAREHEHGRPPASVDLLPAAAFAPASPTAPSKTAPTGSAGGARDENGVAASPKRRADYIAAARRAAHAATVESASHQLRLAAERRSPGPIGRLVALVRRNALPMAVTAGVVTLALAAFQLIPALDDGEAPAGVAAETLVATDEAETPAADPLVAAPVVDPVVTASIANDPIPLIRTDDETAPDLLAFTPAEPRSSFEPAPIENGTLLVPPVASVVSVAPDDVDASDLDSDPSTGLAALVAAAQGRDAAASFEIAERYVAGRGLPSDLAAAAAWYRRAAEDGAVVAQYRLGSLYEQGQGVGRDLSAARGWYEQAAGNGNVQAMHNLGVLVSEGEGDGGVAPDIGAATQWFLRAAELGLADSQFNLGVILARGLGGERDLVASYQWFALAAASGDSEARARRDDVAAMLSEDQLAEARAAVTAWRPHRRIDVANIPPDADPAWNASSEGPTGRALVSEIQTLLAAQGHDVGASDGLIGPRTREAALVYQGEVGLPETGIIDAVLLAALTTGSAI